MGRHDKRRYRAVWISDVHLELIHVERELTTAREADPSPEAVEAAAV